MTHGTITGYSKHRCRCELCAESWRVYQRRYMKERYHGLRRRVSVVMAKRHAVMLMDNGMTARAISLAAGLHEQTVGLVINGDVKELKHKTSEAILGVNLGSYPVGTRVRASISQKIIRQMREVLGMSYQEIADYVKLSDAGIRLIMDEDRRTVRPDTHRRLVVGYWGLARRGLVPAELLADERTIAVEAGP
jgi:DNA-binding Xre family transcriptional regulator